MDLRIRVFCGEQGVSEEEESDELDAEATQVVAVDESGVIATCRLRYPEAATCKLERMVVEKGLRELGVGGRLLAGAESEARSQGAELDGAERPAPRGALLRPERVRRGGRDLSGGRHRACPDDEGALSGASQRRNLRSGSTSSPVCARSSPRRGAIALSTSEGPPPTENAEAAENCPFDEGREDRTPPETWANRPLGGEPDTTGLADPRGTQPLPGAGTDRRGRSGRPVRRGGRGRPDGGGRSPSCQLARP